MAKESEALKIFGGIVFSDPYPYVTDDSELWLTAFAIAHEKDKRLFEILNYLRGVGTNIVATPTEFVPYRLVPIYGDKGWENEKEWNSEKQYLMPHLENLVWVLNQL